jgi:hypothetical protein
VKKLKQFVVLANWLVNGLSAKAFCHLKAVVAKIPKV